MICKLFIIVLFCYFVVYSVIWWARVYIAHSSKAIDTITIKKIYPIYIFMVSVKLIGYVFGYRLYIIEHEFANYILISRKKSIKITEPNMIYLKKVTEYIFIEVNNKKGVINENNLER